MALRAPHSCQRSRGWCCHDETRLDIARESGWGGFARALASDPAILLLDDPWGGVDSVTGAFIRELLISLKERAGTTFLITANRITEVRDFCEYLAVLDEGRLIACGSPDEVERSDHPVVRQFFLQDS